MVPVAVFDGRDARGWPSGWASAFQADLHGFDSRTPLQISVGSTPIITWALPDVVQRCLYKIAQLLGAELVALEVGRQLALAVNDEGVHGMRQSPLIRPEVQAKPAAHRLYVNRRSGQKMPRI